MWYIKIEYVVFYYKVPTTLLTLPKIVCLKIRFLSQIFPLWANPSHITMIQKQQKFKIQTNNVPWLIPIQMFYSSKPCTHPTPLTLPPLYFGFCPQNPYKMIENENESIPYLYTHLSPPLHIYRLHLYNNEWFCPHLWLCSFDLYICFCSFDLLLLH